MTVTSMRSGVAAGLGLVLLAATATVAHAQHKVTSPRRTGMRGDTLQHSPFIPGGHWRPGPPAPVPEPLPDVIVGGPAATSDSGGYFARPNGGLLRPTTSVYRLELRRDTTLVPLGFRTVAVSESMFGGEPHWLVAESRTGTPIATYDSLHLQRADLTPMRWSARNGLSQLAVSFTPDSMFVALQDYQGRGSFAVAVPPGALVTAGMVDRLLEMLPLSTGYRVNASLVAIDSGAPRAVPATITVEGEQGVTLTQAVALAQPSASTPSVVQQAVAEQVIDCWIVVLRTGTMEKRYWVARSPQRVVKTEQTTSGGVLTEMLQPPL